MLERKRVPVRHAGNWGWSHGQHRLQLKGIVRHLCAFRNQRKWILRHFAGRWHCVLACLDCNKRKADRTPEQAKMRLKRKPVQPTWNPLYAAHDLRIESWSKFISEAYWNAKLEA